MAVLWSRTIVWISGPKSCFREFSLLFNFHFFLATNIRSWETLSGESDMLACSCLKWRHHNFVSRIYQHNQGFCSPCHQPEKEGPSHGSVDYSTQMGLSGQCLFGKGWLLNGKKRFVGKFHFKIDFCWDKQGNIEEEETEVGKETGWPFCWSKIQLKQGTTSNPSLLPQNNPVLVKPQFS